MKAIMISDKPKWCAKMMNGEKKVEVRKNKALANAIQKLIDKYGYADIYVYCTKDKRDNLYLTHKWVVLPEIPTRPSIRNGKVLFRFRCYKVEDIYNFGDLLFETNSLISDELLKQSCLTKKELNNYLEGKIGYAVHISDLEIFDEPKEVWEFMLYNPVWKKTNTGAYYKHVQLTKAPQNICYVEVEE